jgi:hypothetical protein
MRHKNKSTSIRVALRLIVGLTTILFVLSLTNALNAKDFTSHKGRFWNWNAKPVGCGDTLEYGRFELTGDLDCPDDEPAITIIGPAKLNLKGYTVSGNVNKACILITGNGARVRNGMVKDCKEGILIEESDRNMIIDVDACNNDKRGFNIFNGHENMLFNCLAKENGNKGFLIEEGTGNKMVKCFAKNNEKKGFSIEKGDDNLLVKCLATNNGHQGFNIEDGAGNKIYYSNAIANCKDGIEIAKKGTDNLVIYNHVEDNGNEDSCSAFGEEYEPQSYAGIDIEDDCEDNEIKHNHACGNLGCNGKDCTPRERNFWDENVNDDGECVSVNEWENNTVCKEPECTPSGP